MEMKMRGWSLLALLGLLLAYALPALAVGPSSDPSRVLRSVNARGAILDLKVIDGKGRPVSGARVSAIGSALDEVTAVTGPDGVAHLDGLPNQSKGTVHPFKNQKQSVSWDILIESGKDNHCTIQYFTVMEGNPLKLKLATPNRIEQKWEPISYQGPKLPLKSLKVLDNNWQELVFYPTSKGVITLAYTRPWEWSGKPMPMVTEWYLAVYTVVKKPRPAAPAAAPGAAPASAPAETKPAN